MSQFAVMPYSDYENACDALRSKTGGNSPITSGELADAIASVQSGVSVSDGIVVTERNSSGYATEVEHYGSAVERYQFGSARYEAYSFKYLGTVNLHGATKICERAFSYCHYDVSGNLVLNNTESIEEIGGYAFANSKLAAAAFPNVTLLAEYAFRTALSVTSLSLPKLTRIDNRRIYDAGATDSIIQIGSVGNTVTYADRASFAATNRKTVVVFTNGTYAGSVLANIRNGASAATLILKASEDTVYGGVAYNAGDTMITSEVST